MWPLVPVRQTPQLCLIWMLALIPAQPWTPCSKSLHSYVQYWRTEAGLLPETPHQTGKGGGAGAGPGAGAAAGQRATGARVGLGNTPRPPGETPLTGATMARPPPM